jgi:hypothetical protein
VTSRILSRNKWMLYAHNQHIVVRKGTRERFVHPVMKALIWALYLPDYPTATIEVRIGDKYKPDVVAFAESPNIYQVNQQPLFWGEAGQTGRDKIQSIVRRFPHTHFAMAKWDTPLKPYIDIVEDALKSVRRNAPFDLINFHEGSEDMIDDDGNIRISFDDVEWVRLGD